MTPQNEPPVWWKGVLKEKTDAFVVKIKDVRGKLMQSISIPTVYYPLSGRAELFSFENTRKVTDPKVLRAFDSVAYRHGHCYANTEVLLRALAAAGIKDAVPYAGWLFTASDEFPIHHSWVVFEGASVLDLSDDYSVMLSGSNGENFTSVHGDPAATREMIVSFAKAASKVPNSVRCMPVGVPFRGFLYIGSPCDPERARRIYNDLLRSYPDHPCKENTDSLGYTKTLRLLEREGL